MTVHTFMAFTAVTEFLRVTAMNVVNAMIVGLPALPARLPACHCERSEAISLFRLCRPPARPFKNEIATSPGSFSRKNLSSSQ